MILQKSLDPVALTQRLHIVLHSRSGPHIHSYLIPQWKQSPVHFYYTTFCFHAIHHINTHIHHSHLRPGLLQSDYYYMILFFKTDRQTNRQKSREDSCWCERLYSIFMLTEIAVFPHISSREKTAIVFLL